MIVGKITSTLPAHEVFKLLKSTMISNVSDFEIQHTTTCEIFFTHGAVNMRRGQHPKRGKVLVQKNPDGSQIEYEIEVYGWIKYWIYFISLACFWLIFPPILGYRALYITPRQLMRNLIKVATEGS